MTNIISNEGETNNLERFLLIKEKDYEGLLERVGKVENQIQNIISTKSLDTEDILDTEFIAKLLKTSKSQIYQKSFYKMLPFPAYKIGRKLFFKLSEVMQAIENGKIMQNADFQEIVNEKASNYIVNDNAQRQRQRKSKRNDNEYDNEK